MTGAERIAAERRRQIMEEDWDAEHDTQHDDESLALAACYYALPDSMDTPLIDLWPDSWDVGWAKKRDSSRIRDLEKAGALIAAEIDRLLEKRKGIKIKITVEDRTGLARVACQEKKETPA